ncbi:MAG: hypothetical protein KGR42_08310 [Acidobacteria bacterium]|nr:hypothetical protein [Acidobacteriota bacterium]
MNEDLLALADLDRLLDRLVAARAGLPERVRVEEIERHLRALSAEVSDVEAERAPHAARLRETHADSERLRTRLQQIDARLGASTNAREAESLHAERDHVTRSLDGAEDAELSTLVDLEPLDEALTTLKERARPLIEERAELLDTLRGLEESLDDEHRARVAERTELSRSLDPALLRRYERALARVGGAGAARLEEGRCGGCHVRLAPGDLEALTRSGDEIGECPSCGRLLVP